MYEERELYAQKIKMKRDDDDDDHNGDDDTDVKAVISIY